MNEQNLEKYKQDIADLESKKTMLSASMRSSVELQSATQLQKMIALRKAEISSKIEAIDSQIAHLAEEYKSSLAKVKSEQDTSVFRNDFLRINNAKAIVAKGAPVIEEMSNPAVVASISNQLTRDASDKPVSSSDFENLSAKVSLMLDAVPDTSFDNLFEKVVSVILLDVKRFASFSPNVRVSIYVLYLIALVGILVSEPVLFYFPYSVLLMLAGYKNIRTNQKLLAFIYPYKQLEREIALQESSLDQKIQANLDKAIAGLTAKFNAKNNELQTNRQQLVGALSSVESEVKRTTSFSDLIAAAQADYDKRIAEIDEQITSKNSAIKRTIRFIDSNDKQLEKANATKASLRSSIVDTYLNPTTPGDSKLLVRSFFLGMDDNEELVEFNYDGKPTLIVYKGDTSEVNAPLIRMMLMQLLANMSIISLRITVTDTLKGGSPYAVFSPKELSDRIKICATTAEVQEAIASYHDEFQMRTKDILTVAESLDSYNEMMLSRHSLTRDYLFLFLQDPDIKLLARQDFLQLCRSGPQLGIIPIVFINNMQLNEWLHGKDDTLLGLQSFIESIDEQLFIFDGLTQDLQFTGNRLKDNILTRVRKGLNS